MSRVSVRAATSADTEAIARLCTQLGYPTAPHQVPARLARFETDANARAFVAEAAGAVVGLLTIHLRHTLNHEQPIGQITLLVVDENNRTHGVGRALVEAAERWATERGTHRVAVTTQLTRTGAHAFYERMGYTHTGRRYGKDFPPSKD